MWRAPVVVLGLNQILAWGSSYYLIAVLGRLIAEDTGWSLSWVVAGPSVGLLVAGLVSRRVGSLIHHHGGRPVLAGAAGLFALGLTALAMAGTYTTYVASWAVLGAAMGAGLYDAAFATLGRLYGSQARRMITGLTLFGGFASTICWPITAWTAAHHGWRAACLAYAGAHLLISLPLLLAGLPRRASEAGSPAHHVSEASSSAGDTRQEALLFVALAVILTTASAVMSTMSVHILTFLQAARIDTGAAVALAALIGPCQVGARILEAALGARRHPVWTLLASVTFVAVGLLLLLMQLPIPALAMIVYGAGNGLNSIARGSMPLALFGPSRYALWMGELAAPTLIAGAASPYASSLAMEAFGPTATIAILTAVAAGNLCASLWLIWSMRTELRAHPAAG